MKKQAQNSLADNFSVRLARAISSSNLKQKDIAKQVGIAEITISRYKGGKQTPNKATLNMLASVLKVSPEWLACETDENQPKIIVEPTKPKKDSDISLIKRKQATFVYTVDLPEGTVRSWVPGFETLSPEEQQKTLHAICRNVLAELAAKGAERLTAKERAELQDLIDAGERALPPVERKQLKAISTSTNEYYSTKTYLKINSQQETVTATEPSDKKTATFSPSRRRRLSALQKQKQQLKHKRTVRFKAGRTTTKEDNIRAQDFFPTEKN